MAEKVLVRFKGGILDGITMQGNGWPPPEVIDGSNMPVLSGEPGAYHKVSQSQLPEAPAADSRLLRGAQYEWRPNV